MIVDDGEGFQVHLGGAIGVDAGFGRKLRGLKVTRRRARPTTSSGCCATICADRAEGERFATWVAVPTRRWCT